jgi:hypothetical protein
MIQNNYANLTYYIYRKDKTQHEKREIRSNPVTETNVNFLFNYLIFFNLF